MQERQIFDLHLSLRTARRLFWLGLAVVLAALIGFWFYHELKGCGLWYLKISSPVFWGWSWYDPEMPYFISSLAALKGEPYTYVDHPGTPVELIGSALLLLTRPFLTRSEFFLHHLQHPEIFLTISHTFLLLASLAAFLLFACRAIPVRHWSDVFVAIAAPTAFFAFHPAAFFTLAHWSHNSFAFPAGTTYLLLLLHWLRKGCATARWRAAFLGFLAGVLTSIQLYFIVWVFGVLVALVFVAQLESRSWKRTLTVVLLTSVGSAVGFFVATLPVLTEYPRMLRWFLRLLTHQGRYGSGPPGILSAATLARHFFALAQEMPETFAAAFGAVAGLAAGLRLLLRAGKRPAWLIAFIASLLVQLIASIFLVLRHPGVIYGLSVASLLPAALIAGHAISAELERRSESLWATVVALVLICFALNHDRSLRIHATSVKDSRAIVAAAERYLDEYAQRAGRQRAALGIVWTYGTVSPCHGLWLGNETNDYPFSREIRALYPREYNLNLHSRLILDATGHWRSLEELPQWDVIVARKGIVAAYPFLTGYGRVNSNPADIVFITRQ